MISFASEAEKVNMKETKQKTTIEMEIFILLEFKDNLSLMFFFSSLDTLEGSMEKKQLFLRLGNRR